MNRPHFLTLSGSRLYGTNREDSDYDFRGVFLESESELLGLHGADTYERKEPDTVIYPLRSFIRLALQGNPNILEILFADKTYWQTDYLAHQFMYPFQTMRREFLSQRCRKTYGGYAYSQLKKIEQGGSPSKNTRQHLIERFGYDTKYAAHTARLIYQGLDILLLGDFNPSLKGIVLEEVLGILAGNWKKEVFLAWAKHHIHILETTGSDLPEHPDERRIEHVLIECYSIRGSYVWAFENRRMA